MSAQLAALLSEYDIHVLVDASGSMSKEDQAGGLSRYKRIQETAEQITRDTVKIDTDGISITLFGGSMGIKTYNNVTTGQQVSDIFADGRPSGSTPLHLALQSAFEKASDKKRAFVVFTDGEPDDKAAVQKLLVAESHKITADDQLVVLFVQVGSDPDATAFLKYLDDNLVKADGTGAKFDIVDTKSQAEAEAFPSTVELLAAAIDD